MAKNWQKNDKKLAKNWQKKVFQMIKIHVHDKQEHEVFKMTRNIIKNLQRCTDVQKKRNLKNAFLNDSIS